MKEPFTNNILPEKAVLGEILSANNLSYATDLKPEDFSVPAHKIIFAGMQELSKNKKPIDIILLSTYLKDKSELDTIGGYAYLTELTNCSISEQLLPYHIEIIKKESIKRRIIKKIETAQGKIVAEDEDIDSLINEMQEFFTGLKTLPSAKSMPSSLPALLEKDIPPVEYLIDGILQKEGRTMISASPNIGKSFFLQNLALAIASGQDKFLGKFPVTQGRVLYLDLEMGEPALKQRFQQMCKDIKTENLFIKYEPGFDLLDVKDQKSLEEWISKFKIDVLIIDPIGDAWSGDENNKQEVGKLTSYLNKLKSKYKIAILISHHWKKKTKENKRGGEMASGSYKWQAWLDHHITLEGDINCVTVSCEKDRNNPRFDPFIIKLNKETFFFEFVTDFEQKFNEQTLSDLFDSFNSERVEVKQLIERAKEQKICAGNTIRKLIKESTLFETDKSKIGRAHV